MIEYLYADRAYRPFGCTVQNIYIRVVHEKRDSMWKNTEKGEDWVLGVCDLWSEADPSQNKSRKWKGL